MGKQNFNLESLFERQLGDRHDVLFWEDLWVGETQLKFLFPCLFRLETVKEASIKDRVEFSNSTWSYTWCWTRNLTGRLHGELIQLKELVEYEAKIGYGECSWKCKTGAGNEYKSKFVTEKINELTTQNDNSRKATLRNNLLPQKIRIFIWRTMRKRIPTRVELDKRGVDLDTMLCPMCNDTIETVEHAILECKFAKEIWEGIFKWWGTNAPSNLNIESSFKGNGIGGISGQNKNVWQAIEWVTGYFIWKNRNNKVFGKDAWGTSKIINEIQIKTHEWINNRSGKIYLEWHQWLLQPSSMNFPNINNHDPG
ncbi:uncharacterized protein [Rutidosis leptorrhynchoides]|uniref:uncharacterized protein n=1 Tax=Rutidosis leptorrhynchoides TaxID=125765 RepID=UPI003A990FF1